MSRIIRTLALGALLVAMLPTAAIAEDSTPVDIVILGGTAAVPANVEAHLASCTDGSVTRISGSNRYKTAVAISKKAFPGGATSAFIAIGTNYPDGVVAGAAAAYSGAPLLLTEGSRLPSETWDELKRLGVTDVFILGGTSVISSRVQSQLAGAFNVTRLAGATRYATAAAVSAATFPGPVDVAYVTTGEDFPDALVGGTAAFSDGAPMLLTDPDRLSPETAAELERLQVSRIIILGGTAAVSASVEKELAGYGSVSRIQGRDRYATAAAIAASLPGGSDKIYITTAHNFPDALAGTPLVGESPMLLTSVAGLPPATAAAISSYTGRACTPIVRVSHFTTYHASGQSRVKNIHLIADATNGAVVMPGDVFSLNDRVGRRTTSKGYVAAGAIINGEIYCCDHPANIGGGTSQFATTLYNAIFFGAYEDWYHRPHSIWFSRYPMGREATLGWTSPDVKFRNDTNAPVMIRAHYTSSSITVEMWGWNDGRRVSTWRSGSATTNDGGSVRIYRKITYADGTRKTQSWYHRYNPLHPDD